MKRALICGVSGQDGAYLSRLLLSKNYEVIGSSRDAQANDFDNLRQLGVIDKINKISLAPSDFRSVLNLISDFKPDEIYNLSGQSSVSLSFDQPIETEQSITVSCLNFLEAIKFLKREIKYYNAGSSECFGDTGAARADEATIFKPKSPYAVAKCSAHWHTSNYRESYGMFACTGILFNHESPLRHRRFVTKKIIETAKRISLGSKEKLILGNVDIIRDWGYAPDYVEAMWLMLQQDVPDDFVIATGESCSLLKFVERVFNQLDLNYNNYLDYSPHFMRPSDARCSYANPSKANSKLGWVAKTKVEDLIKYMIEDAGE